MLVNVSSESRIQLRGSNDEGSLKIFCTSKIAKDIFLEWNWTLWLTPPETIAKMVWFPLINHHLFESETDTSPGSLMSIIRDQKSLLNDKTWFKEALNERSSSSNPSTPRKRSAFADIISPKRPRTRYDFV